MQDFFKHSIASRKRPRRRPPQFDRSFASEAAPATVEHVESLLPIAVFIGIALLSILGIWALGPAWWYGFL